MIYRCAVHGLSARVAALLAFASAAAAQFDTLCPNAKGGPYTAYNVTRCPSATATCCTSIFNPSGVGCCPHRNAVCCGNSSGCCPEGTACVPSEVAGLRFNCTAPGVTMTMNFGTCKGGPPLPMSATRKNVIYIGDSLSIGMMPFLAANLSDLALVQHAPWGGEDGGAEETAYGLRCLDFFLASPSGMAIKPDAVIFNFGA